MIFHSADAQPVFERYEARAAADAARQKELGPAVLAVRDEFLLPVGKEVGALLHALIIARRPRRVLELGTSYGYSTLFLADAAKAVGAEVVTMELADYKQAHARAELADAGLADVVEFHCGDALQLLAADPGPWDFVLLDIWKELYLPCLEAVYPKLSEEGVIASDNIIDPAMWREDVRRFRAALHAKPNLQSVLLPVGSGIELSVKWSAGNPKL
ncbi:O-methyltransferase [Novosphingobium aquae]|jgi:predicted O-methyltransferase YrrM|uniref:Class I SAM-dependent methyltransferase n=1 Tax=Novosphingobium aquae TaxID=3133435 RepID=A0ABU8S310_9SPHN